MQSPSEGGADERGEPDTLKDAAGYIATALLVVIALSVDELNPVKVICSYTLDFFREVHVALLAALCLLIFVIDLRDHILYHSVRLFFRCTLNNMFFRSVEIVGMENLPKGGPCILTGNHNNQFVDGLLMLTNTHREISFMIAQKSWDRPLVGFLARAFHCMPVARPQDLAFKGRGTVTLDESTKVHGKGTQFTSQVSAGVQLEFPGSQVKVVKVKEVVSDTELVLEAPPEGPAKGELTFKVLPKVDQSAMYEKVYSGLRSGKCLGIFPEGGSHDRTDLLPLKAGVAIIALDAFHKHHITVPIVPVGLNYFEGHRFGGRVVIEFGPPITIPEEIYMQHETDRRGATEELLQLISASMRGVIVPTPDYHTLQQIYMVRRLFTPDGLRYSAEKTMDLNRRFAIGTQKILQLARRASKRAESAAQGDCDEAASKGGRTPTSLEAQAEEPEFQAEHLRELEDFRAELDKYMALLKRLGLRDHQVRQLGWWSLGDVVGRLLYLVVTMGLGAIPQLLFNLPVMLIAGKLAVTEQKKALQSSTVKLQARDVVMSYKIIYVLVLVPCLYLIYGFALFGFSSWSTTTIILILAGLPLLAFFGMKASEQGIKAYTDVVPLFLRLFSSERRREQDSLPARRATLKRRLRFVIKLFGPHLGDLYSATEVDWNKEIGSLARSASELQMNPSGGESPLRGDADSSRKPAGTVGKKVE